MSNGSSGVNTPPVFSVNFTIDSCYTSIPDSIVYSYFAKQFSNGEVSWYELWEKGQEGWIGEGIDPPANTTWQKFETKTDHVFDMSLRVKFNVFDETKFRDWFLGGSFETSNTVQIVCVLVRFLYFDCFKKIFIQIFRFKV